MSPLARHLLRAPWTARAWRATAHLAVGLPLGLVSTAGVVALAGLTVACASLLGPAVMGLLVPPLEPLATARPWTWVLVIPLFTALLWWTVPCTAMQRRRFAATLRMGIMRPPARRRLLGLAAQSATWRQLTYHLLAGVFGTVEFVLVAALWLVGPPLAVQPLYIWWLPGHGTVTTVLLSTVVGAVGFHLAPWAAIGCARLDFEMALWLLGPSRRQQLAELSARMQTVVDSRSDVIASADAERRRIERDLHDGAQQRLVSLAMNLGIARLDLDGVPDHVRKAIEDAHEEAKLALTELRDLVRGLHPAVLDERGLDAALSGISARSPVPVTLAVDLPHRPSRTTEAVAYFVVSEALANAAKHAHASRVDIRVSHDSDGVVTVVVSDDGRGGARLEDSTGLRGLAQRVGSIDGSLRIDSPVGAGTVLIAELPCVS
ncbi:sensor histidine kinase [Kutzneria kofuensis]|uniref:histidine kinase n=1 Tax=Kutzneria kofuensis TaxID=103725 RepID=A0A7W9KNI9_9PSEU|nr:sensor histidine kinase [Kutzneria kofuensis]MBB5895831.1 signal transduction histidine kinase [Kutzneria kofuensis]